MSASAVAPRMRVIVVEDDAASAAAIAGLFGQAGLEPLVCPDVHEAVPMALDERTGLVSLDLGMHGLDGFDVLALIRSHEQSRKARSVPVMAITGRATSEDRARSLASGFASHLTKPVSLRAIALTVARIELLRSRLYASRYSQDRDAIVEQVRMLTGNASGNEGASVQSGLLLALESQSYRYLYQMALAIERTCDEAATAARRLSANAEAFAAEHLRSLCERFGELLAISADPTDLEEAVVLVRAELDRVIFTMREEAVTRLAS